MFAPYLKNVYAKVASLTATGCAGYVGWQWWNSRTALCEALQVDGSKVPKPSRTVNPSGGLKQDFHLTLFQYQTCPFCSKVRAFMDYYGYGYDVIEVNPLFRTETKFSEYRKIPFMLYNDKSSPRQQELLLPDSSLIVSLLRTVMQTSRTDKESVNQYLSYYPELDVFDNGKPKKDYGNKYYVMYEHDVSDKEKESTVLEAKWRKWVDETLVHTLAPNIYRTPGEALSTFEYLAEAGEWKRLFPAWQVPLVIYVGAGTMYLIGKRLKKRYGLADDVRISLYEACDEWVKALKGQQFLGGKEPNLADLAAFGVLNAIEGTIAFKEATQSTKILPWYQRMRLLVVNHMGTEKRRKLKSMAAA